MEKKELEDALKNFYTIKQLSEYFNLTDSKIRYQLEKYNLKPLLDSHVKDERGNTYGDLTVIDFAGRNKRGEILWNCICKCGTETVRSGVELRRTRNKKQKCINCLKKKISEVHFVDHSGEQIGSLTVIKPIGKNGSGNIIWLCNCKCGNQCFVDSSNLKSQKSCGCLVSKGEFILNQILTELMLSYKTQYTFDDCRSSITNSLYKFDFAIFREEKLLFLIEYNGAQHYSYTNSGWNTKENYEKTKFRDNEKIKYCQKHNIPLLIIPYFCDTKENIKKEVLKFLETL